MSLAGKSSSSTAEALIVRYSGRPGQAACTRTDRQPGRAGGSSPAADLMLIRFFGVVDVEIPFDDDFALLAVLAQLGEASPMFVCVFFRQLAAEGCLIVTLAVIGQGDSVHTCHYFRRLECSLAFSVHSP